MQIKQHNTIEADDFFNRLAKDRNTINRYVDYWEKIVPKDDNDYYLRWLFAFLSVRARWYPNVVCFEYLTKLLDQYAGYLPVSDCKDDALWDILNVSGIGLQRMRYKALVQFDRSFRANPELWYPEANESLTNFRNRLGTYTYGIGLAKVSFLLEMAYPFNQEVICLDTHMLRMYEVKSQQLNQYRYEEIEKHWCERAKDIGVSGCIARHIWWDRQQGYDSTDYWAYVFKGKQ